MLYSSFVFLAGYLACHVRPLLRYGHRLRLVVADVFCGNSCFPPIILVGYRACHARPPLRYGLIEIIVIACVCCGNSCLQHMMIAGYRACYVRQAAQIWAHSEICYRRCLLGFMPSTYNPSRI